MSSEPLRVGVIGLGRAFSLMLPTFVADQRVQLVAGCDPQAPARDQFAREFDAPVYCDPAALLANPDVELVYIASPHQFHAAHTALAAGAGKHVLVEKPMALSLAECDAMIAASRESGIKLIVGHCHSFDAPYLKAREIIVGGELGPVKMIVALNYTDFLYRPRRPEELSTAKGGGVVYGQAVHQVDVVRLLACDRAVCVRAVVGAWDADRPTEGAYQAMLRFKRGAVATLAYSGYGHFDSDEWCGGIGEMGMCKSADNYGKARRRLAMLKDLGEEGHLKAGGNYGGKAYRRSSARLRPDTRPFFQHFGPVVVTCEKGDLRPVPDGVWVYGDNRREHRTMRPPDIPRSEVIDELWRAIRLDEPPFHDGEWARATLEICLAILTSASQGKDVALTASG